MKRTLLLVFFIAIVLVLPNVGAAEGSGYGLDSLAKKDTVCSLLSSFRQQYSVETANLIMAELEKREITEYPLTFSATDSKEKVQMTVNYHVADYLYLIHQYDLSIGCATEALALSKTVKDKDFQADILSILAIGNTRLSNFEAAAHFAEQCYLLDKESGDLDRISSSLNTLAGIYVSARRYDIAEKYVLKGIEVCKKAKYKPRLSILLGMASEVYHAKGNDELSLDFAQKAYDLDTELGREPQAMIRLSQRASALIGLSRFDEAEADLLQVIPYFRKVNNLPSLIISCNKMGRLLYLEGRFSEASQFYREAADISAQIKDSHNEMQARKGLFETLISSDSKEAQIQYELYDRIKDSLYNLASAESLSHYEASLENDALKTEYFKANRAKHLIILFGLLLAAVLAVTVWLIMRRRIIAQRAAMESALRALRMEYEDSQQQDQAQSQTPEINKADQAFLDKLVSYVADNIDSGRLGVEDIASHMCLSSSQLGRKVKSLTGLTTQNYVLRLRLERAKMLLHDEPESSVADIASRCGFEDAASFSRAFKRTFNTSPSKTRG